MLNVKLLPKQWEVFHTQPGVDYDIKLYQGGVGSGKTFLGALKGLRTLAENPGATWLVGADTYARLKISTCETYEELLDGASIRYQHNKTDHVIRIPGWDDARVLFKGLDDATALRSVNGIGGHLEEASLITEGAYLEFLGRLRQAKAGNPISVILTTNPQATRGWLYDHFVKRGGITEETVRDNVICISRQRVIARSLDNPHISDAFLASLQASYDPELYRIMVEGEDGNYTAGLVVKNWSIANVDRVVYDPKQRIYISMDFNVDPMCWVFAHRVNGEYHVFDELCVENTNIVDCVAEIARRYGQHAAGIIVTGDASGKNRDSRTADSNATAYTIIQNELSKWGVKNFALDLPSHNPLIDHRVQAFNAVVYNKDGQRRLKVDPSCKQVIHICENLKYIPGTSVIWQPTPRQIEQDNKMKFLRDDMFDAVSYLVHRYDPIRLKVDDLKKPKVITSRFSA